jgi:hypothetical protein
MTIIHKVTTAEPKGNEFILSDATIDRYGDSVDPNGWVLDNFLRNPAALFAHQSSFAVGTWQNVRVANGALRGHLKMAPAGTSDRIDEIARLIDAGVRAATPNPRSSNPTLVGRLV